MPFTAASPPARHRFFPNHGDHGAPPVLCHHRISDFTSNVRWVLVPPNSSDSVRRTVRPRTTRCYAILAICDNHRFEFDPDKAFADQLTAYLEASPEHPLSAPHASREFGVYVLYQDHIPVYVGQAVNVNEGVRGRLSDHLRNILNRQGLDLSDITCRHLLIRRKWEVSRAEDALIARYNPPWNGIPSFSSHVPGAGRPGMPNYTNEWDSRYPPIR